jgi:hypothetical protein
LSLSLSCQPGGEKNDYNKFILNGMNNLKVSGDHLLSICIVWLKKIVVVSHYFSFDVVVVVVVVVHGETTTTVEIIFIFIIRLLA